jgi:hypothetical protein
MWVRELGKRVVVLVLTVAVVLAAVAGGSTVLRGDGGAPPLENPEYDPATVALDPLAANGTVEPAPDAGVGEAGTVLIDRGHGNNFDRADIAVLVDALVRQGWHVEFYTGGDLAVALEDADAFLVIDPGREYQPGDVDDVRQFTGNGGHLVMVGEPDRTAVVSSGFFGSAIQLQESRLTTLASRYRMSVDTQYLYNQEHADGTFKHVLARSTGEGDLDDVETAAFYTAAAVTARDGTVLMRSAPNTYKSGSDEVTGEFPVVVRRGNALLLGDSTFLRGDRFNVADNEHLIAYLVEFMVEGEHEPPADDDEETVTVTETKTETETETETPAPNATVTTPAT